MGVKIDQLDVPVCNSFRPKIIRDQLCYTVDPNKHKHKIDLKGEISFSFLIHYNEDRQMEDTDSHDEHDIIINTIGKIHYFYLILFLRVLKVLLVNYILDSIC